jgi:hypothetical protein
MIAVNKKQIDAPGGKKLIPGAHIKNFQEFQLSHLFILFSPLKKVLFCSFSEPAFASNFFSFSCRGFIFQPNRPISDSFLLNTAHQPMLYIHPAARAEKFCIF